MAPTPIFGSRVRPRRKMVAAHCFDEKVHSSHTSCTTDLFQGRSILNFNSSECHTYILEANPKIIPHSLISTAAGEHATPFLPQPVAS